MGIGVSAYATGIFFQVMFSDLGWARGDLALAMSVGLILGAVVSPFVGAVVDKHGASRIMAVSAFATGACLVLLAFVHELWQVFIIFTLLAVFRAGFVSIPVMTMVSNWFSEKRGRAMGITTAGQGLGGIVLSPLTIYLISALGWRASWGVLGILTWVIMIPPSVFVAKQRPEDMGLLVDGREPEPEILQSAAGDVDGSPAAIDKWTPRKILKVPVFWFVALLHSIYLFGHISIFHHGYALFIDRGIPAMTAGTMIGVLGFFSLSGKIVLGYLSDRIPVRYVMMTALLLAAVSMLPLFMAELNWQAWLFIVFWGFLECGVIALQPVLVASLFDKAIIGKMLGIFTVFSVIPQLVGPPFTGYVFDITGSYNLALVVFIAFYIVSAVLVFLTRPPRPA